MSELRFSPQKDPVASKQGEYKNDSVQYTGTRKSSKKLWKVLFVIVVLIVLGGLVNNWYVNRADQAYYSVALVNNQMYFGQIEKKSGKELVLTNVHYLAPAQSSTTAPQLVRLDSQVYKPENSLRIPIGSILFYQPLKSDSQIVQLITTNGQ
jgi:hypothetical protein